MCERALSCCNLYAQDASSDVEVAVTLNGFDTSDANTRHGFHVHMTGDISGGCGSAGGHYNPDSNTHGAQTADMNSRCVL